MDRQHTGVGLSIKPEIGYHVREVCDSDISTENGGSCNSDEAGPGAELEDTEAAGRLNSVEQGGEWGGGGRVTTVVIKEADKGGSGWPELEGEALGWELLDHHR